MKTEVKTNASKPKPARVDLGARYKRIGISAVAAAMRYTRVVPAETDRETATPAQAAV